MVYCKAQVAKGPLLFLPAPPGNHERMTLVPQAMILWRGLDLVCYNNRYSKTSPITGCVYTVTDFDDTTVTVQLHAAYARKAPTPEKAREVREFRKGRRGFRSRRISRRWRSTKDVG